MIKPAPAIKVASVASSGEFQYPKVGTRAGVSGAAEEGGADDVSGVAEEGGAAEESGAAEVSGAAESGRPRTNHNAAGPSRSSCFAQSCHC